LISLSSPSASAKLWLDLKKGSSLKFFSQNADKALLERNLKLYPLFYAVQNIWLWGGSFFLFFTEQVSLQQAISLQAVYYFAVVFFEVPSGFSSDVLGRKITLLIANLLFISSYSFFYFAHSYPQLMLAQLLLAAGFAFISGTDQSFHYESLKALGRDIEFGARESRITKNTLATRALTSVLAGLIALYSLRLPYLLSIILSLICLVFVFLFSEPPREKSEHSLHKGLFFQIRDCLVYFKHPKLRWLFIFTVSFVMIAHIPFEYYQGYIDLLDIKLLSKTNEAPFISGLVRGLSLAVAAVFVGQSLKLKNKFGLSKTLLLSLGAVILLIWLMGTNLNIIMIALLLLRTAPNAIVKNLSRIEVAPLLDSKNRATYLSLESFSGRLFLGLILFFFSSLLNKDAATTWESLSYVLKWGGSISVGLFAILFFTRSWLTGEDPEEVQDTNRILPSL